MIVGGLGDFFGAHLFPVGAYFYGFTLTNIAVGAAYALTLPRAHRARYETIVLGSARCAVCSEKSGSAAMQQRNRFMVENSSLVIAVYDGKAGGTRNTVALAKDMGRDVWLVSPE